MPVRFIFLLALAASAGSPTAGARASVDWVWSGAVTPSTATVKAKLAEGAGRAELVVGDRSLPGSRNAHGIVSFELEDLAPGTDFEYRVEVDEGSGLTGRFRTFEDGPMSFDFVFGSCARTGSSHEVFATMEALEPLFVLHMGDFHYESIDENDLAEYREAFDEVLASERQSSLYRSAPIAYVWDDHDYGPDNADGTFVGKPAALAAYDEVVPHYPLERVDGVPRDIHQAFTVGRTRFLLTDVRSHREPKERPDGPGKTMLGVTQREWLLDEIAAARDRYALVVWVNPVPWIAEPGSEHGWGSYDWERRHIADRIESMGMVDRLLMLSGDAHMVAIDDGTHSSYASDRDPGVRGFPVFHAAPLDRYPRVKGGPYSHGTSAPKRFFGIIQIQQFGLAEIRDDGEVLEVTLTGRDEDGDLLEGMEILIRCDDDGCAPSPK